MTGPVAATRARILDALRRGDGWVSGQALGNGLGISRMAIAKHVRALQALGYRIESATRRGYRLTRSPDRLGPEALELTLPSAGTGRGRRGTVPMAAPVFEHHDSIDSTNRRAKELAAAGCPARSLVVAEAQTAGRGRRGRAWHSPAGSGIYASLVLRPTLAPEHAPLLTLAASVAIAEALCARANVATVIKWPNDVLVGTRKIAGILTEMVAEPERMDFAVVGFGINVNLAASAVPAELRAVATSLRIETGRTFRRAELLADCLKRLGDLCAELEAGRFDAVLAPWRARSNFIGRRVRVETLRETRVGLASDVGPDGSLVLETADGVRHSVLSGDVTVE
jgi:BirA family biotin operon repressor/biotin-[acetyl-CoA-carboxylase] ligase